MLVYALLVMLICYAYSVMRCTKIERFSSLPISHVYYINLDHRTDRRKHIEAEIRRVLPDVPCTRIAAVHDKDRGYVGCAKSHLKAIETALGDNVAGNVLVLEDDFEFRQDASQIQALMAELLAADPQFHVCLLGYNMDLSHAQFVSERVFVPDHALTTSGYIVSPGALPKVRAFYAKAVERVTRTGDGSHAIDVAWWELQGPGKHFYGFHPRVGVQRRSYSDIAKGEVDYGI